MHELSFRYKLSELFYRHFLHPYHFSRFSVCLPFFSTLGCKKMYLFIGRAERRIERSQRDQILHLVSGLLLQFTDRCRRRNFPRIYKAARQFPLPGSDRITVLFLKEYMSVQNRKNAYSFPDFHIIVRLLMSVYPHMILNDRKPSCLHLSGFQRFKRSALLLLCTQESRGKYSRGIPVDRNLVQRITLPDIQITFHGRCSRTDQPFGLLVHRICIGTAGYKSRYSFLYPIRHSNSVMRIPECMFPCTGDIAVSCCVYSQDIVHLLHCTLPVAWISGQNKCCPKYHRPVKHCHIASPLIFSGNHSHSIPAVSAQRQDPLSLSRKCFQISPRKAGCLSILISFTAVICIFLFTTGRAVCTVRLRRFQKVFQQTPSCKSGYIAPAHGYHVFSFRFQNAKKLLRFFQVSDLLKSAVHFCRGPQSFISVICISIFTGITSLRILKSCKFRMVFQPVPGTFCRFKSHP